MGAVWWKSRGGCIKPGLVLIFHVLDVSTQTLEKAWGFLSLEVIDDRHGAGRLSHGSIGCKCPLLKQREWSSVDAVLKPEIEGGKGRGIGKSSSSPEIEMITHQASDIFLCLGEHIGTPSRKWVIVFRYHVRKHKNSELKTVRSCYTAPSYA